jgi:hypothetical protein
MRCLFVVGGAAVRDEDEVFMAPIFIETPAGDKEIDGFPWSPGVAGTFRALQAATFATTTCGIPQMMPQATACLDHFEAE